MRIDDRWYRSDGSRSSRWQEKDGKQVPIGKRWLARYDDHAGAEHTKSFDRKTDAEGWLKEQVADLVTGNYVSKKRSAKTFGAFWEEWTARQVWSRNTRAAAASTLKCVTFTEVPLGSIDTKRLQEWIGELMEELSPSTVRLRMQHVRSCFKAAVADKRISLDPTQGVDLPRVAKARAAMAIPTPADVGRLLEAAPDDFYPILAVCAFAGLRVSEACGLKVSDITRTHLLVRRQLQPAPGGGVEETEPKHGSVRDVPMPVELAAVLGWHLHHNGARSDGFLFSRTTTQTRWDNRRTCDAWRKVRDRAGVSDTFKTHSLRHFYASALIGSGVDVVAVCEAMGHSTPSITLDKYSHLWPRSDERTAAAVSAVAQVALMPVTSPVTRGAPRVTGAA